MFLRKKIVIRLKKCERFKLARGFRIITNDDDKFKRWNECYNKMKASSDSLCSITFLECPNSSITIFIRNGYHTSVCQVLKIKFVEKYTHVDKNIT